MLDAALWGLIAASSLIVGATLAFTVRVSERGLGLVLAFGAGVLISAVAYELVAEALSDSSQAPIYALGFGLGSLTFFVGSVLLARMSGDSAGSDAQARLPSRRSRRTQGMAIVLGTILDGIPESVVLGVSLIGAGAVSVPMLAAIFISNVPEAMGASADLERGGVTRARILALWGIVVVASAVAAGLGYALLSSAAPQMIGFVQMFAAGAIIAMLAESMVPEAYEKGGRPVGLATALGFAVAATLSITA
jgi:zinc transporter, ZIP family